MSFFKWLAYGTLALVGVNLVRSYMTDTFTDANYETWTVTHEKRQGGPDYWYATANYSAYKDAPYPPALKADSRGSLVNTIVAYVTAYDQKKTFAPA